MVPMFSQGSFHRHLNLLSQSIRGLQPVISELLQNRTAGIPPPSISGQSFTRPGAGTRPALRLTETITVWRGGKIENLDLP